MQIFHLTLLAGIATLAVSERLSQRQTPTPGNWSVQLMADLKPDELTVAQWNEAVDIMISKNQAYILSDLVENLGIAKQIPDDEVRDKINEERELIDLPPLPPHQEPPSPMDLLNKYKKRAEEGVDEEDFRDYLPAGWTEEKFQNRTQEDIQALTDSEKFLLRKRAEQRAIAALSTLNNHYLELLPNPILNRITTNLHDKARRAANLPEDVRLYKRSVAPLVQLVEVLGLPNFGFVLYRTWYDDEEAWKKFLGTVEQVNAQQLNGTVRGIGTEIVREKFVFAVVSDEERLREKGNQDVVGLFRTLITPSANASPFPRGIAKDIVLVADEAAINSIARPGYNGIDYVFLWAVDTNYNPDSRTDKEGKAYPEGYNGVFKVHPSALLHDLYVPVGAGEMTAVELWGLLQENKEVGEIVEDDDGEEDEDADEDEDEDEWWMHGEL